MYICVVQTIIVEEQNEITRLLLSEKNLANNFPDFVRKK